MAGVAARHRGWKPDRRLARRWGRGAHNPELCRQEKKLSKHPEEFGHGAIEGVVGPEAANNAARAGVLVPLLTIGLPTSAAAAVILVAFRWSRAAYGTGDVQRVPPARCERRWPGSSTSAT